MLPPHATEETPEGLTLPPWAAGAVIVYGPRAVNVI
jgi:hypothetical protein